MSDTNDFELLEVLWEHRMVTDAEDHYLKAINNKQLNETKLGEQLLQEIAPEVQQHISVRQRQAEDDIINNKTGKRNLAWKYLISLANAQELAFAATQNLMSTLATSKPPTYQHVCLELGECVIREIRFQRWRDAEPSYSSHFLRRNSQALASKAQHLRFARKIEKKIEHFLDSEEYDVTRDAMFGTGAVILDCVRRAHPDMLTLTATGARGKLRAQTVYYSDDFLSDVSRLHAIASISQPIKRPMLVPPKAWKFAENGRIEGGYYLLNQKVYRTDWHPHKFVPSQRALDSLNAIQKTPWRINKDVYDFLCRNPYIGPQMPVQKPKKLPPEQWASLDDNDKRIVQQQFNDDLASYVSQTSKAMTFERQILQAQMLAEKSAFWQPHSFDFRGRLYPANQMLTSQGDHVAKALIEFSNGKPIGEKGLAALKLQVANTYGYDKLNIEERLSKVDDMRSDLELMLTDDKKAMQLVRIADEPMAFYAAAVDLARAWSNPNHISHLPIAVDGTCNGLQILSLLGKDEVGASKTNCTASTQRKDLYLEVGLAVRGIIENIILKAESTIESDAAHAWYEVMQDDRLARKVVKRAVMTTAYGVTPEGIREQLVADRMVDPLTVPDSLINLPVLQARHKLASFMRDWILVARVEVVSEAVRIMDYLRDSAKVMAENGYPLSWETPDGCQVSQKYVVLKEKHVRTFDNWMRRLRKRTDQLSPAKNAGAAAPNVVHSLDAAMCRMVATKLVDSKIEDMAFVHDSYAVHACHLETLNNIIRDVAVSIFKGNWLSDELHQGLLEVIPNDMRLPEPPKQGKLNVKDELPNARYFFS